MIDINKIKNIYLYTNKIDMRVGMYRIEAMMALSFSPIEILHSAFIFVSKSRRQVKIYYEDEFGKWLLINKLSYSKFMAPSFKEGMIITREDLSFLLKGVALVEERKKQIAI